MQQYCNPHTYANRRTDTLTSNWDTGKTERVMVFLSLHDGQYLDYNIQSLWCGPATHRLTKQKFGPFCLWTKGHRSPQNCKSVSRTHEHAPPKIQDTRYNFLSNRHIPTCSQLLSFSQFLPSRKFHSKINTYRTYSIQSWLGDSSLKYKLSFSTHTCFW